MYRLPGRAPKPQIYSFLCEMPNSVAPVAKFQNTPDEIDVIDARHGLIVEARPHSIAKVEPSLRPCKPDVDVKGCRKWNLCS